MLRRQAGVRDCLVVAYDSAAGPAPAAVLIAGCGQSDDFCKRAVDDANRELAPFQQIRYWLRWPQPEFPRTSTGKVLRRTVQSWAQQSLATGGAAVEDPADRLIEVLRQLGATNREVSSSDRLAEDLHLDSLAMVQLQSTLETRFGVELEDAVWGQVRTVGDLRGLLQRLSSRGASVSSERPQLSRRRPCVPAVTRPRDGSGLSPLALVAAGPLGAHRLSRSGHASAGVAGARPPHRTAGPACPALTADRQPSHRLRRSGHSLCADAAATVTMWRWPCPAQLLTGWRRGKAERHRIVAVLTPLAYWLVTALFNVFPLPRGAGLRQSFAHAGEAMDQGYHVLVFPEGRRSADGRLQPFEPGIGLLAQESEVPVQPILVEGLKRLEGKRWPRRGTVAVRLGAPLTMEPGKSRRASLGGWRLPSSSWKNPGAGNFSTVRE